MMRPPVPSLPRPLIGSGVLLVAVLVFIFAAYNRSFWSREIGYYGSSGEGMAFLGAFLGLVVAGYFALRVPYVLKPLLILSIVVAGMAAWFADGYGVIVTRDMIDTVLTTTANESRQYFTADFLHYALLWVALPALLVAWVRVAYAPFWRTVAANTAIAAALVAASAGLVMANYSGIASTVRQRGDIIDSANPTGPATAAVKYVARLWIDRSITLEPLGRDARELLPAGGGRKPAVTILVAGETARADHFSLNGYGRDTNPELAKLGVVSFADVTSCGTLTSVSIPCMFSVYPRDDFSDRKARSTENLMDVLTHAGLHTEWWENNTGDKDVAQRIARRDLSHGTPTFRCANGECRDDVFLSELDRFLDSVDRDTVLVLHTIGSHGPSYHLRYSADFARFQPECMSAHLSTCAQDTIVNAYDNSILFTDHVLAGVVERLKARATKLDGAMLYLSDHGESLGEDGLYLHGTPYMIAPEAQTHVPMVLWLSEPFSSRMGIDLACVGKAARNGHYSQDNLFHSVLGMMRVKTDAYDPALDIFAPCSAPAVAMAPGWVAASR